MFDANSKILYVVTTLFMFMERRSFFQILSLCVWLWEDRSKTSLGESKDNFDSSRLHISFYCYVYW